MSWQFTGHRKIMITLSRLNGTTVVINAELIEMLEVTPDTIVTLTNGKKILVQEAADDVIKRVVDYRRETLKNLIYFREEAES